MVKKFFFHALFASLVLSSCVSHKELVMLPDEAKQKKYRTQVAPTYKIKAYDQLAIKVNSYEENTVAFFNGVEDEGAVRNVNEAGLYLQSFAVDERGILTLPLVGDLDVLGLTTSQLKDTLDLKLSPYLKFASTTVKLTNFRVTVLGEVANPGIHYIYDTKASVFQVLGYAGGVTEFGNRARVKLVREEETGTFTKYLDLSDPAFLDSDEYFLRSNDIIYIEPLPAMAPNINLRSISVGLSVVSVLILAANVIVNASNN